MNFGDINMICECCGEEIKPREPVVMVKYGFLSKSNKFYIGNQVIIDYFHKDCDKAFRENFTIR